MAKNLTVLQLHNISILKMIWNKGADLSNFIKQCFDYKAKDKKTIHKQCTLVGKSLVLQEYRVKNTVKPLYKCTEFEQISKYT